MIANFFKSHESNLSKSVRLWIFAFAFLLGNTTSTRANAQEETLTEEAIPTKVEDASVPTAVDPIEQSLAKMSLEQKIGQMLILGFPGTKLDSGVSRLLKKYQPGALILFGRNVKEFSQVHKLNSDLQTQSRTLNGVPLFIMVDQEGGAVARVKTKPPMPSALALGHTEDPAIIREVGRLMGELLSLLGFNFNLAPVMDVGTKGRKSFIANRAFSEDPKRVSEFALAFSSGLSSSGVVATAKHFPGHGGLVQDSHKGTPNKLVSLEELEAKDLEPFREFSLLKTPVAMMVAHVAFPNIDPSGMPAAFSSAIITDLLRDHLKYDGLVITDDIEMLGADAAGGVGERAIKAVEAGCDMVMVAWSPKRQDQAFKNLVSAVKSGRISVDRIDQSIRRILKAKLALPSSPVDLEHKPLAAKLKSQLAQIKLLTRKVHRINFEKSLTSQDPMIKFLKKGQAVIAFSADPDFFDELAMAIPSSPIKKVHLTKASISQVERLLKNSEGKIAVYYATGTVTARQLDSLPKGLRSRLFVINGAYPGAIESPGDFRMVIELNSLDAQSAQWLAKAMFQEAQDTPAEELRSPAESPDKPEIID